jgi:hypothetical protein
MVTDMLPKGCRSHIVEDKETHRSGETLNPSNESA